MKNRDLIDFDIDYEIIDNIDENLLIEQSFIPLYYESLFLVVATSDKKLDINKLVDIFSKPIKTLYIQNKQLQIELKYLKFKKKLFFLAKSSLKQKNTDDTNSFIIEFIDTVLSFSIENRVSDIHFECLEKSIIIRFRIDGVLNQFFRFDISLYSMISSIIKYLGNLDISQKRLPLNSSFTREIKEKNYDFRVSTMPSINGESIVLRILDNQNAQKELQNIGFDKKTFTYIENVLELKQGLLLVTGPTGSGKTTTLYSMINQIDKRVKKIITVEDPVEYKIEGVTQVNINYDIKLDFHKVLKNILRQDPDILVIGEIRDEESLQIALQAALTGHLVIATLHTNGSIDTIVRLNHLGAKEYLIGATLKLVLSQRLVRKLCDNCKIKNEKDNLFYERGCEDCGFSGYKDRTVVYEVLKVDKTISQIISTDKDKVSLEKYLFENDFKTLKDNGMELLINGTTSPSEYYGNI